MSRRARTRLFLSLITLTGLLMFVPVGLIVFHPVSGTIAYVAAWDTSGVTFDAAGGWTTVSDLGYDVHVERGYVVTYSATMNACDHATGLLDWAASVFAPHRASAGHDTLGPDPAAVQPIVVASLTSPETSELGTVTVHEFSYCQGHALSARAAAGDTAMAGLTLWIEGTYRAPGSTAETPFVLLTADAYGGLYDLTGASGMPVHAVVGRPIRVTIERRLATLFDGVDFLHSPDAAYETLKALMQGTRMIVSEGSL
jgi:hypothetical protein